MNTQLKKVALLAFVLLPLRACLILNVDVGGTIGSLSGVNDCDERVCEYDAEEGFKDTFIAKAAEGYEFTGWEGYGPCVAEDGEEVVAQCEIDLPKKPEAFKEFDWDITLTAKFNKINDDPVITIGSPIGELVPLDQLVAHYPLNGDADDATGNGNNGTEFGGVSYSTGAFGQAADFDGSNDYIDSFTSFDYEFITVSLWFNSNDVVGSEGEYGYVTIFTQDSDRLEYGHMGGILQGRTLRTAIGQENWTSIPIEDSKWYHLVSIRSEDKAVIFVRG